MKDETEDGVVEREGSWDKEDEDMGNDDLDERDENDEETDEITDGVGWRVSRPSVVFELSGKGYS